MAKAKPTTRKTKTTVAATVAVRMYCHGLGDCFLLTFPKDDGKPFYVLIDCGVIIGTENSKEKVNQVAKNLKNDTGGVIDLLVATHEHWDHISGFIDAKDVFAEIQFKSVWLAWTENPADKVAKKIITDRKLKLQELQMRMNSIRQQFGAADNQVQKDQAKAAEYLSFFGIDASSATPSEFGMQGSPFAAKATLDGAMKQIKDRRPTYCEPGEVKSLDGVTGVRVYVLGPPNDLKQLYKDKPTKKGKETYEDADHALAARPLSLGQLMAMNHTVDPFTPEVGVPLESIKNHPLLKERYFDDESKWRQVDFGSFGDVGPFAMKLDADTNNTSLVLAFELPNGRVLLFPGDAQVGNWESWHADSSGKELIFDVDGKTVTAQSLLKKTLLYKVGHHGSHNATLKDKGLEMMTSPDLIALIPVDECVAHVKKDWTEMPFKPILDELHQPDTRRVYQADQTAKLKPSKNLVISDETVDGFEKKNPLKQDWDDNFQPATRPLFIELKLSMKT